MEYGTIGAALKRKGVTQRKVVKALGAKYGLCISQPMFNEYARRWWYRPTPTWKIIRACLEKEFGIVYEPMHWN